MKFWSPLVSARKSLRRLNQAIFSCFLEPAYPHQLYLFEHRIHQAKRKYMQAIVRCSAKECGVLNHFFDAMMNYAQLRWRVSDFTVFSICLNELKELEQGINEMILNEQKNVTRFSKAIERLGDLYQQALQVSSPDPLAFLLFIEAIKGIPNAPDQVSTENT